MSLIILNVDEVGRALSASDTSAFVVNDKNVDIVRFALLTGFADVELDEHSALRVMYQRPGEAEVRAKTLTYYDTDGIRRYYDWELLSADLAMSGVITCAFCILRTDGKVEEWHTTPYQIRVLGSIHTDDSDEGDETITPTVIQRLAVLETMIQRVASGAPIVVANASAMTDTDQIYVLSTDGNWYYHNGSAWVAGGEYGAVVTDTTLSQSGMPADAKAVGDALYGGESINYIQNKNIVTATGELTDENGTCTSEFIPLTWTGLVSYDCGDNTKYTYTIAFYNANKEFIQGFRNPSNVGYVTYRGINAETQVTQGTPAYVRFSFKSGYVGKVFLNAQTNYWIAESHSTVGLIDEVGDLSNLDTADKSSLVDAINEVNGRIPDITLPIKPSDTNFFYASPNLADPSDFVADEFVNQTNGVFTPYSGHTRTGFIPVTAGKTYCIVNSADFNAGIRYAFYSSASESAYLSGAAVNLDDIGNLVTAPTDAAYMVMSASTFRYPFMVAESTTKIDYAEYGDAYLLPEYVLDEDVSDILVNLPSKIYALVGYELNIYFENIIEDWTQFNFDVTCTKGMQLERGYQITPTDSDVGTYPLSIVISSKNGRSSKAVTTTLVVASASAGSGITEKVLVLGDSTTNSGYAVTELAQNLADDSMSITLLGTRGTAPYLHEGRSGWTFNLYFTSAGSGSVVNPFYNPNTQTFDANYYFTNTGVAVPDWFFINLGINDTFSFTTDSALKSTIPAIISLCDAMIASVKSVSADIKIGLCITIPPNHSQDAFGKAYACGQTRSRYKRNNVIWANSLIAEYDGRESENIYLIPIYTNLDTVWNMGMETLPVNARNTTVTYQSPISNGGVHPVASGYWQIADVYTAFLKANV